jgi:hypothetical protein
MDADPTGREQRSPRTGAQPSPQSAQINSLWYFPVRIFVPLHPPVDAAHDHYLGLNRVGGLISEAMKSAPSKAECKPIDMTPFAAKIAAASSGALSCSCWFAPESTAVHESEYMTADSLSELHPLLVTLFAAIRAMEKRSNDNRACRGEGRGKGHAHALVHQTYFPFLPCELAAGLQLVLSARLYGCSVMTTVSPE